jgi:hypothetical protein
MPDGSSNRVSNLAGAAAATAFGARNFPVRARKRCCFPPLDILMHDRELTLHLDHDTFDFLRQEVRWRNHGLRAVDVAQCVERLLRERRRQSWRSALGSLWDAGWSGSEVFAAIDISTRHRLDSAAAELEIASAWTHIRRRHWRRRIAQWCCRAELRFSLRVVAHELDALDSECKQACLAMYERHSLWTPFRRRHNGASYARVKRLGPNSFVATRLR